MAMNKLQAMDLAARFAHDDNTIMYVIKNGRKEDYAVSEVKADGTVASFDQDGKFELVEKGYE
jgi:hypothetical protein